MDTKYKRYYNIAVHYLYGHCRNSEFVILEGLVENCYNDCNGNSKGDGEYVEDECSDRVVA